MGEVFPGKLKLLVELRYLAVRGSFVNLPLSIGNLTNLQTLIVDSNLEITLPDTVWDLQKLRHLWIQNGFHFPVENLVESSGLFQLESCSVVIFESRDILEKLIDKFSKVIKLKLKWRTLDTDDMDIFGHLQNLEVLHVSMVGVEQHLDRFYSFGHLQLLTLKDLELTESGIFAVGKLPCLQSLKLLHVSFSGGEWRMKKPRTLEEFLFQSLKYLKLSDSNILRWTTTATDYFFSLEKLVVKGCVRLEELPTGCLSDTAIEVFDCSPYVELQVKQIQEKQWKDLQ